MGLRVGYNSDERGDRDGRSMVNGLSGTGTDSVGTAEVYSTRSVEQEDPNDS